MIGMILGSSDNLEELADIFSLASRFWKKRVCISYNSRYIFFI